MNFFTTLSIFIMIFLLNVIPVEAKEIKNPDGSDPLVHWAILQSSEGQMENMQQMAAKHVAPYASKEDGTYILYGGVDKNNPNILRLLEIYKDEDAYQQHRNSEGFKQYQIARATILEQLIIMEANPFILETKDSGIGHSVHMVKIEVLPEKLDIYKQYLRKLIYTSMDNPETLAIMATTEKENPNIFHILEIFTDEDAYNNYLNSNQFKEYHNNIQTLISKEVNIDNQPTTIKLTNKPILQ